MSLEPDVAQSLLAEPHVGVLSVEHPGQPPLAVPLWYSYAPGGDLWILTETESFKAGLLRRAGRCTLTAETVEPRVRWVSVACELVDERPGTEQDARVMAERYLPPEAAEGYLEFAADNIGAESVFTLRPGRWRSADVTPG